MLSEQTSSPPRRWLRPLFGLLALLLPSLVGYDIYFQWSTATLDFGVDETTGRVNHVPEHSFGDWAGLWEGDVILSIEGVPFSEWHSRVPGNYVAEVQRGDRRLEMELYFVPMVRVNRWPLISGVVTALVFWGVGTALLWRRAYRLDVRLLFLFMQAAGVAALFLLAHAPGLRMPWMTRLSLSSFHLVGALVLHHILTFPRPLGRPRFRRLLLGSVYAFTLVVIVHGWLSDSAWSVLSVLGTTLVGLLAVGLWSYVYARRASAEERRRLRLILFGLTGAGIPTVVLYIAPLLLNRPAQVPRWTAGFFLILAPLSYLVATIRHRLFEIDRLLNRALVYGLLSLGILLLYLGPFLLLYRFLPGDVAAQILVVSALTLLVGLSFDWVRTRIQRLIDRFFYGGWYDYPGVIETVSDALARTLEREALRDVLTRRVPALMRLRHARLEIAAPDVLASASSSARLTFPLRFQGEVRARWDVGPRRDGDDFTAIDRRILSTLARQAEVALGNVLLVETLRQRLEEIREAQHRLLRSREEERARLARELHDGPIQLLVGLNLQLGLLGDEVEADSPVLRELRAIRDEIRYLLSDLRQVCSELRPPMLDTLGLGAAIRALTEAWSSQEGVEVELDLTSGGDLRSLPPEVTVNLYRVVQEALTNVARHADADHVTIRMQCRDETVDLTIRDDGQGFTLPSSLDTLLDEDHYGLLGIRERVELIGGELRVASRPGEGTRIEVSWEKRETEP